MNPTSSKYITILYIYIALLFELSQSNNVVIYDVTLSVGVTQFDVS